LVKKSGWLCSATLKGANPSVCYVRGDSSSMWSRHRHCRSDGAFSCLSFFLSVCLFVVISVLYSMCAYGFMYQSLLVSRLLSLFVIFDSFTIHARTKISLSSSMLVMNAHHPFLWISIPENEDKEWNKFCNTLVSSAHSLEELLLICMYVCLYVCMSVCMYVCMYYVCMYYVCTMYFCMYVLCMYVCMYVCTLYVCMYAVCTRVFMYVKRRSRPRKREVILMTI
jgi:hypothetical protein